MMTLAATVAAIVVAAFSIFADNVQAKTFFEGLTWIPITGFVMYGVGTVCLLTSLVGEFRWACDLRISKRF